jgi:hypothetical protein
MGLLQRMRDSLRPGPPRKGKGKPSPGIIGEIIGRVASVSIRWINRWRTSATIDQTLVDAAFWDQARRGKVPGLELSAPLLNPIYSKIAAWSLGRVPKFVFENRKTQELFDEWLEENHADLLKAYEESLALGNLYVLINADLTVTLLPPDIVDPLVDAADYSRIEGWRVTEVYPNPDNPADVMRMTDEYYADERWMTKSFNGATGSPKRYKNLIGRIPLTPIRNNVGVNEAYGRPEGEGILNVLYEYNDVLKYGAEGNKRQGRPTPVIEELGDAAAVQAFFAQYGRRTTYRDENGVEQEKTVIDFDSDQLLVLGNTAKFKWSSPQPFMADTSALLGLFFYLIVQYSELPEFVFGTAIASSKASADAQLPTFTRFIEKKQAFARKWLADIAETVTAYLSLIHRGVQSERPTIQFAPLTNTEGKLTLDTIIWARKEALMDKETALRLAPVDVDDIQGTLRKAEEEQAAAQAAQDARDEELMVAQLEKKAADEETSPDDESEESEAVSDSLKVPDWPSRPLRVPALMTS